MFCSKNVLILRDLKWSNIGGAQVCDTHAQNMEERGPCWIRTQILPPEAVLNILNNANVVADNVLKLIYFLQTLNQ